MSTQKLNIFTNFGLALKEALLREGKTPAWLSRETGKDKGQISKYINGNTVPRAITQQELTKPLSSKIVQNAEDEWEVIFDGNSQLVEDVNVDYRTRSYREEKESIERFFSEIKHIQVLFEEVDSNKELSEQNKLLQIKMIKNQLRSLLS